MFDYLIVGAGFAGSVLAERLASVAGKKVLLVEKRNHVGGNAYDCYDDAGILIHKYGPHIFHTNSADVFSYLSKFTAWRPYQHRVRACVDGQMVPIPINRDDRYFTDTYQAMPLHGYTRLFERMLAHPNIKVLLNCDWREVRDVIPYREVVYTGPIDEFFEFRFGKLPYRSLHFEWETRDVEWAQSAAVINYTVDQPYTRV